MLTHYGSMADPLLQKALEEAAKAPSKWSVYLVMENGNVRTKAQNALYQSVLRKFAQQQGKDVSYWNDYFVKRFLGYVEFETEDGYLRQSLVSTTTMTVEDFAGFLNAVLAIAAEMQIR